MVNDRVIRPEWVPEAYRNVDAGSASNKAKIIYPLVAQKPKGSLRGTKQLRTLRQRPVV